MQQQPLWEAAPESIALSFTQTQNDLRPPEVGMELPMPGADTGLRLEDSVLGSIIRGLDPNPPDTQTTTPATAASSRSFLTTPGRRSEATQAGSSGMAREWAAGAATAREHTADPVGDSPSASLFGPGGEEGTARKKSRVKKPLVRHGLRVLLRGTTRCGKSSILFDCCHRAAAAGYQVVLVCLKKEDALVHLPYSMRSDGGSGQHDELRGWEASALGRIGLKYVRSRDDLAWYLGSLHTLPVEQRPTLIAVDDLDRIVDTSAGGGHASNASSGGVTASGGGVAAALRILALLQDTAEYFDRSRPAIGVCAAGTTASVSAATVAVPPLAATVSTPTKGDPTDDTNSLPGQHRESTVGAVVDHGVEMTATARCSADYSSRQNFRVAEAVRVVATCSISDRSLLALYGRFMHVVARVQNTTGPDRFSVRADPGLGTAPAQQLQIPTARANARGGEAKTEMEFVRLQANGSFAVL